MPRFPHLRRTLLMLAIGLAALTTPAHVLAEVPHISMPENLLALLDLRIVASDGERSWTAAGFGKARFGPDDHGFSIDPVAAEAMLIWQPPLSWDLRGTVSIAAQHEQDQPLDVVEAFVSWRPVPRSATRVSARAGMFWPPISLEHGGPAWTVTGMITPSAINSWIGEEVKVVGVEGTVARDLGSGQVAATLGIFGFNDTAATLLSFRGWALHDQKTGAFSRHPLPPLNSFLAARQPPWTTPSVEIDGRPGFYARLAWRGAPVSLDAFYYSNRGDPEAKTADRQWGWDTRFLNIGAQIDFSDRTRLFGQALVGTTEMGIEAGGRFWVETRFRSAYLRLTHRTGPATLSGRLDLFDTRETGRSMGPEENESGWAFAGALSWSLSSQADLMLEGLHIDSRRGARIRGQEAPEQAQNLVQVALRITL